MKRYKRQLRLGATLTLSALILAGHGAVISPKASASSPTTSEIKHNIDNSPKSVKVRILGASIFSVSILATVIIISREITSSRPTKEKILRKYYS